MQRNQTIFGLIIIAIAVLMLLANINIGFARELIASWWPLLVVGGGLYILWSKADGLASGLIVTGIGLSLLINSLGVFGLSLGDIFVPVLLLSIGAAILMGGFRITDGSKSMSSRSEESVSAILGGVVSRNSSKNYRGGSVSAVMGGADIDLSGAKISKEAVLQVWVLMGGITLRVPDDIIIKQRTTNILGSFEDKTVAGRGDGPVLYIDGTVILGSVEVKR